MTNPKPHLVTVPLLDHRAKGVAVEVIPHPGVGTGRPLAAVKAGHETLAALLTNLKRRATAWQLSHALFLQGLGQTEEHLRAFEFERIIETLDNIVEISHELAELDESVNDNVVEWNAKALDTLAKRDGFLHVFLDEYAVLGGEIDTLDAWYIDWGSTGESPAHEAALLAHQQLKDHVAKLFAWHVRVESQVVEPYRPGVLCES